MTSAAARRANADQEAVGDVVTQVPVGWPGYVTSMPGHTENMPLEGLQVIEPAVLIDGFAGALVGTLGAGLVAVIAVRLTRRADRANARAAEARCAAADLIQAGYTLIQAPMPEWSVPTLQEVTAWHGAALRASALIRVVSPRMSNLVAQAADAVQYRLGHPLGEGATPQEAAFHLIEPVAALNDMLAGWLAAKDQQNPPPDARWEPGVEFDILRQDAAEYLAEDSTPEDDSDGRGAAR